jgi:transposase
VLDAHAAFIFGLIEERRDITLEEIAERVASERGVRVVSTAVWKFLDRHTMTHKKRPATPANKSAPM